MGAHLRKENNSNKKNNVFDPFKLSVLFYFLESCTAIFITGRVCVCVCVCVLAQLRTELTRDRIGAFLKQERVRIDALTDDIHTPISHAW